MNSITKIIPSLDPVNALAKIVTSHAVDVPLKGPKRQRGRLEWDAPPQCSPVPREVEDLTGRTFGRLTVCGWLAPLSGTKEQWKRERAIHRNRGHLWLVRCACGRYEARRRKAIVNPDNTTDMCCSCLYWEKKKRPWKADSVATITPAAVGDVDGADGRRGGFTKS